MKKNIIIAVLVTIIMYLTNPSPEYFKDYIDDHFDKITHENLKDKSGVVNSINKVLYQINGGDFVFSKHQNYLIFSIHGAGIPTISGIDKVVYLGIFNLFIRIQ
jgi:hypothetical protein